jgi:hypothetical protein
MDVTVTTRTELIPLTGEQRERVLEQVRRRHWTCPHCGGVEFDVGDALYLGFLFRSEDRDAHMVALSCRNPGCAAPRTGIRLPAGQFL